MQDVAEALMTAYNSALESEGQCRRSVGKFNGAAGIRVVIGHSTEEGSRLEIQKDVSHWFRDW